MQLRRLFRWAGALCNTPAAAKHGGRMETAARIACVGLIPALCAAFTLLPCTAASAAGEQVGGAMQEPVWQKLEEGLDLGQFEAPGRATLGDSKITVLRIDPRRFKLGLYSASALKLPGPLKITAWMESQHLAAAINGGMFEPGGATVGFGRAGAVTLNPAWKANYGALLALDPAKAGLPAAAILDVDCDDLKAEEANYGTVLQSMRMIDCKGGSTWKKSGRIWSTAALAVDGGGRVLFIAARSPWDVHDFIANLQALPLDIARAMYLEGGPEVSLAVRAGGVSQTLLGSFESGFNESGDNAREWELPNVIGITRIGSER
jgi:uncharacterized protein YigE (DUF2233 family)